eukprot:11643674-Karenia_brevis.AAC.1
MATVFNPGDLVYVEYVAPGGEGFGLHHERLVIAQVEGNSYMIATPTFDLYVEDLDMSNPDLYSIRVGQVGGGLPLGITAENVFGFGLISHAQRQALQTEGERLARLERLGRGIGGAAPAGVIVPAGAVAAVPVAAP